MTVNNNALNAPTANISSNNFIPSETTTVTTGGTTVLTVASTYTQTFSGSSSQTVQLPDVSTLTVGHPFYIINNSTNIVTVNSSGGNTVLSLPPNSTGYLTCILTSGTTAASWYADPTGVGTDLFPNGLVEVTTTSQAMIAGTSYLVNSGGGQCTLTLPAVAAKGSFFAIIGKSPSGWIVQCAASQQLIVGTVNCTAGTGYFASIAPSATVIFQCIVSNQTWQAIAMTGNLENDLAQGANAINAPFPFSVPNGGTGVQALPTVSTPSAFAAWDANKNLSANNFLEGFTTTVTSGTPVVLTVASTYNQFFTGSTAQTVTLPVTSTLVQGHPFYIVNASTAVLTIQSSGGNTVSTLPANSSGYVTCILTSGTTAASWSADATGTGTDVFPNGTVFVTSSTQTIVNGTVYAADGVGIVTVTLPGASFGSFFAIVGVNGWRLNIGSGQNVIIGSQTVTGPTNYWVSTNNNDAVMFEWTTSNTCQAISCVGNPQTNLGASALPYPSAGNGISVTLASGASVVSVVPITNTLSYNAGNIAWALGSNPCLYSAYTAVTGNATLSNPSNPVLGGVYTFVHTQATGTGPFTLSYGANYKFSQGIVPVITTAAGAVDILTFQYDGTLMRSIGISQNIS